MKISAKDITDEIIRKVKIHEELEFKRTFENEEELECYCDFEFEGVYGEIRTETVRFKIDVLKIKVYLDNWWMINLL